MTCKDCQLACYDLLDRSLCAKDEREVLAHIEQCLACRSFLEVEGERMRTWPRLLGHSAQNAAVSSDVVERVAHALEISQGKGLRPLLMVWSRGHFSKRSSPWFALAASVLVLASLGAALSLTKGHFQESQGDVCTGTAADGAIPAVRLVKQTDIQGLNVPETLPGLLSLDSGELVVRLQTGVELTLVGPASVNVRDGLQVYLDQGKLLASVPHWATGFTVRTRELEIRDLGTVFGVQVKEGTSEAFVFKGRVQVNEAGYSESGREMSGAGVGICEAGEGVRAVSGERPVKIAADWPEAKRLFGAVKAGRAFRDPRKTFETATRIADLWAERHNPESNLAKGKGMRDDGVAVQSGTLGGGTAVVSTDLTLLTTRKEKTMNMQSVKSTLAAAVSAMALTSAVPAAAETAWTYYAANKPDGCGTNYARIADGNWVIKVSVANAATGALNILQQGLIDGTGVLDLGDEATITGAADGKAYHVVACSGPNLFYTNPLQKAALTGLILPSTLTTIDDRFFEGFTNLVMDVAAIPAGITNFKYRVFFGCSKLYGTLTITNVQALGVAAFSGCTSLTGAHLASERMTEIPDLAFDGCTSLVDLNLDMPNLGKIGVCSFRRCPITNDFSVACPVSVTNFQNNSFVGPRFTSLVLSRPGIVIIGENFARENPLLTNAVISSPGFTSAGKGLFGQCTNLQSLTIGSRPAFPTIGTGGDYWFINSKILTNLVFYCEAPTNKTVMDFILNAVPGKTTDVNHTAVIYASKRQKGWTELASVFINETERANAPAGCFGVYTTAANLRKAWMVHRASPYDPLGTVVIVR